MRGALAMLKQQTAAAIGFAAAVPFRKQTVFAGEMCDQALARVFFRSASRSLIGRTFMRHLSIERRT